MEELLSALWSDQFLGSLESLSLQYGFGVDDIWFYAKSLVVLMVIVAIVYSAICFLFFDA